MFRHARCPASQGLTLEYKYCFLLLNDVERHACGEDCMILIRFFDHDCEMIFQSSFEFFERIARK